MTAINKDLVKKASKWHIWQVWNMPDKNSFIENLKATISEVSRYYLVKQGKRADASRIKVWGRIGRIIEFDPSFPTFLVRLGRIFTRFSASERAISKSTTVCTCTTKYQVLPPCTWKMRRRVYSVPRHLEDKSLHIFQIYYSQIHILKSISCIHILIFAALVCPVHPPCAFGGGWLCLQGAAAQWQGPIFKGSFYPCYLGGFFYQQIFFRTMPSLMRQNLPKRAWRGVRTVTAILPHP